MNEKVKLKHYKENVEDTHYIEVHNRGLTKATIIKFKDVEYEQGKTFGQYLEANDKKIAKLEQELETVANELAQVKDILNEIVKGLNIRWRK